MDKNEDHNQPQRHGFFRRRIDAGIDRTSARLGRKRLLAVAQLTRDGFNTIFRRRQWRTETFKEAMLRQGLSEATLARAYRYHAVRCYIFLLAWMASWGIAVYNAFWYGATYLFIGGSMGLVLLTLFVQASWSAWRIQQRRLESVFLWLHDPGSWLPGPYRAPSPPKDPSRSARPGGHRTRP